MCFRFYFERLVILIIRNQHNMHGLNIRFEWLVLQKYGHRMGDCCGPQIFKIIGIGARPQSLPRSLIIMRRDKI